MPDILRCVVSYSQLIVPVVLPDVMAVVVGGGPGVKKFPVTAIVAAVPEIARGGIAAEAENVSQPANGPPVCAPTVPVLSRKLPFESVMRTATWFGQIIACLGE